ncbi:MFS transporter [Rossellomorea marisflavi]|jgi:MFS transporter, DHA1 family, purine base/nucleoside efflux pump|uniref:MFS transporter n=1 Tax=Rossellomorea marisflavi TaxID=189381 RepID=UPI0028531CA6|nr:MFS transporter [Rossellomorea marisflavi]MDR4936809.1 MFS transporter [Rossellomorea marisflavi]
MNWRVYVLAASTFAVGLVELIVGGILPNIAEGLEISLGKAGQLITVFALAYAISAPLLLSLTAKVERKKLYLMALSVFTVGNIITFFSTDFTLVIIARIITAMSTALVVVLSLTIAAKLVDPSHRAKALGLVFVGISSSLVLGVPIGIFMTETLGWRSTFLGIAVLSAISIVLNAFLLEKMPVDKVTPLKAQFKAILHPKVFSGHLISLFMLAGHYMFYAYFTPYLIQTFDSSPKAISIFYLLIGLASVCGNWVGGWLSDRIGSKSIVLVTVLFALVLFAIPFTTGFMPLFVVMTILWGGLSWALTPALQNYLIQTAPETSDIQQSINTSALQVGISVGSALGGTVVSLSHDVSHLASFGSILVVFAIFSALFSLRHAPLKQNNSLKQVG